MRVSPSYLYIGTKLCGCTVAAVVDDPEFANDTADAVAEFIRDGLTISRIPRSDLSMKRCTHSKVPA